MNRHVVAGLLILALAGCARDRVAQRGGQGVGGPVGLPPEVPPISETINQGAPSLGANALLADKAHGTISAPLNTGGAIVPAPPDAMGDPSTMSTASVAASPGESGGSASAATASPSTTGNIAALPGANPAAGPHVASGRPVASTQPHEHGPPAALSAPAEERPQPSTPAPAMSSLEGSSPASAIGQPTDAGARTLVPPAQPGPGTSDPLLGANPQVMPEIDPAGLPPRAGDAGVQPAAGTVPVVGPATPPLGKEPKPGADSDVMPNMELAPAPTSGGSGGSPVREDLPTSLVPAESGASAPEGAALPKANQDSLLGASPSLMPDMQLPPPRQPRNEKTIHGIEAAKGQSGAGSNPAGGTSPPTADSDVMPPIVLPPDTAKAPGAVPAPVDPLPPVVAPPPAEVAPPSAAPSTPVDPAPPPQAARAKRDSGLARTAGEAATVRSQVKTQAIKPAGEIAAHVGDDIITFTELTNALKDQLEGQFKGMPTNDKKSVNMLAAVTLQDLIDRNVIYQEVKRKLKDPKKLKAVNDIADRIWTDSELPAQIRKHKAEDEKTLREILAKKGRSLDDIRENHRINFLTHGYLEQEVASKFKAGLSEMRDYYNEHLNDFDRPAQRTWREVLIEVDKSPNRVAARQRAESALARLRRGDDFAKVAQSDSDGPNKSRGGVWQTSPGGYSVASVNAALETTPVGEISSIIEGPTSFHIIRVDERREAGPARFDEVQDEIREIVQRKKSRAGLNEYIVNLRKKVIIRTMFDGTDSDPALIRASAKP